LRFACVIYQLQNLMKSFKALFIAALCWCCVPFSADAQTYCSATAVNTCGISDYYVDSFSFINNNGGTTLLSSGCNGGPGNYMQYPGQGLAWGTGQVVFFDLLNNPVNPAYASIWIDWNQDGDFIDGNEQVYLSINSIPASQHIAGSFTVPVNVNAGGTTMRIRTSATSSIPSCGTVSNGETEDFTVNVVSCSGASAVITGANNQPICAGYPDTLYASATGLDPLLPWSYEWLSSPAGSGTFTSIAGATDDQYIVYGTSPTEYQVVVSDGICTVSSPWVTVDVINVAPPVVLSPVTTCAGAGMFTFSATGSNLLWYDLPVGGNIFPGSPSILLVNPGTTTYYVTQTVGGCESPREPVTVTIDQPATPTISSNAPICIGDTAVLSITNVCTGCVYIWSGPNSFAGNGQALSFPNLSNADTGTYCAITASNGCTSTAACIYLDATVCIDSVWPGDANYDLIADNNDILQVALGFGNSGTARSSATIQWQAEASTDWGIGTPDYKHADCDGSGFVGWNDTVAISQNYGMTHLKPGVHLPAARTTGLPDLYFDLTNITLIAGSTAYIPVMLGTSAVPMNDIMGLAAQVYVVGAALDAPPAIDFSTCWMGNNTNSIHLSKGVNNSRVDFALARTDHQNINGSGQIATLKFDIPQQPSGPAILYIDYVTMIDKDGQEITGYNLLDDTTVIFAVGVEDVSKSQIEASVIPNPSQSAAQLAIRGAMGKAATVRLSSATGQVVKLWEQLVASENVLLPLPEELPAGLYFVEIQTGDRAPRVIKWLKQ
jgi:hypothetical protein